MSEQEDGQVPVSIFLQPIAPPYILGLYAFAGGAAVAGVGLAGWYGAAGAALYAWPFVAFFGGLAQFVAGLWAFRARDGLATAIFGLWGSLWLAYGLLQWLFAARVLARPAGGVPEVGVWFMVVAWVTVVGAYAATAFSWVLTGTLALATMAMAVAAAGEFGAPALLAPAGWLLVITAGGAWYTASALLLQSTFRRPLLPTWPTRLARQAPEVAPGYGEPGVRHG